MLLIGQVPAGVPLDAVQLAEDSCLAAPDGGTTGEATVDPDGWRQAHLDRSHPGLSARRVPH